MSELARQLRHFRRGFAIFGDSFLPALMPRLINDGHMATKGLGAAPVNGAASVWQHLVSLIPNLQDVPQLLAAPKKKVSCSYLLGNSHPLSSFVPSSS